MGCSRRQRVGEPLGCVEDANTLCLNDGRFRVTVAWRTKAGQTGVGQAVPLTDDTGYFWFFNDTNVEIVLKVLDACPTAFESFWVFVAGLTDVEAEIVVFDTGAEVERKLLQPSGQCVRTDPGHRGVRHLSLKLASIDAVTRSRDGVGPVGPPPP